MNARVVLAIAAHPDDIEFMMSGTLFHLKDLGWEVHLCNLASGDCGSAELGYHQITQQRWNEAQEAAAFLGASIHPPVTDDLHIIYSTPLLAKVAALVRVVKPEIVLLPSPQDYMEDHSETSRLGVTAVFSRGMKNFATDPALPPWMGDCALYHALPYGLHDGLRHRIHPDFFIDATLVQEKKRQMLAKHRSQKEWLDVSQGAGAYLLALEAMSQDVGAESGQFRYGEGWRRHSHLGFGPQDFDPLKEVLIQFYGEAN